jgi:hypothetical protein
MAVAVVSKEACEKGTSIGARLRGTGKGQLRQDKRQDKSVRYQLLRNALNREEGMLERRAR